MKILIVGAGLIGVATAYFLSRDGHEVKVVERQDGPGRETSFANGALLTPGMAEPWNAPGSWRVLLSSLGHSDAPLQLRWRTLPSLVPWGIAFLRNSGAAAFERNTRSNQYLGSYSLRVMRDLLDQLDIEYGRVASGSLKVFRDEGALDRARETISRLCLEGLRTRTLSRQELVLLEPALAPVAAQLAGAIHYETDEVGDAYRFCVELAKHAARVGAEFTYGTEVVSIKMEGKRLVALASAGQRFSADRCIVAAGSYSALLMQRVGVRLPIRPAKGYSLTIEDYGGGRRLSIPVIDDALHAVIVPLGNGLRVAGTAEFAGYDLTLSQARLANLVAFARSILPAAQFDAAAAKPWCGLRPMTEDGVPIIGTTPVANLFVNTGHGHLGWTTAAGSGRLLADLLCGKAPELDPASFSLTRFGRA